MMPEIFPVRSLDAVFNNNYSQMRSGGERVHQGIDIGVVRDGRRRTGDVIMSGTPGVAVTVRREHPRGQPRSGNSVTVRDPDGWLHHYAHLEGAPFVVQGAPVVVGTPLGRLGNSGNARNTAAHLHYQVEFRGQRRNPYAALAAGFAAMRTGALPRGYLGDATTPPVNDEAATPAQRESAREVWRELMPSFEALIARAEGWPSLVWDGLSSLQNGDAVREARAVLAINTPIVRQLIAESKRSAQAGRWIQACVQLRTATTMYSFALAPLLRLRNELPDSVKAVVVSVTDLADFLFPGSTQNYTTAAGLQRAGNAAREFRDDVNEAASDWGGLGIALVAGVALWGLSQSKR